MRFAAVTSPLRVLVPITSRSPVAVRAVTVVAPVTSRSPVAVRSTIVVAPVTSRVPPTFAPLAVRAATVVAPVTSRVPPTVASFVTARAAGVIDAGLNVGTTRAPVSVRFAAVTSARALISVTVKLVSTTMLSAVSVPVLEVNVNPLEPASALFSLYCTCVGAPPAPGIGPGGSASSHDRIPEPLFLRTPPVDVDGKTRLYAVVVGLTSILTLAVLLEPAVKSRPPSRRARLFLTMSAGSSLGIGEPHPWVPPNVACPAWICPISCLFPT